MWKKQSAMSPNFMPWVQPEFPARKPAGDDTRRHAANWFLATTGMSLVTVAVFWFLLYQVGLAQPRGLVSGVICSVAVGLLFGSWSLMRYTLEYRDWLYTQAADGEPLPARKERAAEGTLLRGANGVLQRVEVALDEQEIARVAQVLQRDGACSVRSLLPVVGDRASALRYELHRIGILEKPQERAATKLTAGGKKAVEKW